MCGREDETANIQKEVMGFTLWLFSILYMLMYHLIRQIMRPLMILLLLFWLFSSDLQANRFNILITINYYLLAVCICLDATWRYLEGMGLRWYEAHVDLVASILVSLLWPASCLFWCFSYGLEMSTIKQQILEKNQPREKEIWVDTRLWLLFKLSLGIAVTK